jgi:hypothetical protein
MSDPKWEDTVEVGPTWEDTEEIGEVGQLETAGIAAAQGLTFDFADEIAGIMGGTWDYLTSDEKKTLAEEYREDRDAFRRRADLAFEQNPATYIASDVAGGIIPALFTGGATAVASAGKGVAKGAVKGALKSGVKQAAKTGAKTGAAVGLGASEADLTKGEVGEAAKDVAIGTGLGAGLGVALPVTAEGIKRTAKGTGEAAKGLAKMIPDADIAEAGFTFGKQGKAITEKAVDQDMFDTASKMYRKLVSAKSENNLKSIQKELDSLGYTAPVKKSIDDAIDDIEKLAKNDVLSLNNKDLIEKLKKLSGRAAEEAEEELLLKAKDKASIKQIKSEGKAKEALIKSEKSIAKDKELSNLDVLDQDELYGSVDDLPGSVLTEQGELLGKQATFETPEGETFVKKYIQDVTEYQPTEPTIRRTESGRPVAVSQDLGSGKIETTLGKIEDTLEMDLDNLTISEAENLRSQLNRFIKRASSESFDSNDPVLNRAKLLAADIKDIVDKAVSEGGEEVLKNKRLKISNILSAEEELGIKGKLKARRDADKEAKINQIAEKLGLSKAFKGRQQARTVEKMLGEDVMTPEIKEQFEILKKVNKVLGRETSSQDNITKAGLYRKAAGSLPNIAGRATSKISTSRPFSAGVKAYESIMDMPTKGIELIKNKFMASPKRGYQTLGAKLQEILDKDIHKRPAALASLQQVPAFREGLKDVLVELESEYIEMLDIPSNPDATIEEFEEDSGTGRTPQGTMEANTAMPDAYTDSVDDFFKPQTDSVDLNVNKSLLKGVKEVLSDLGYENAIVSSGRRDDSKARSILKQRKNKYGLNNLGDNQSLVDEILLRGTSSDNLTYPRKNGVPEKEIRDAFPDDIENEIIKKITEIRSNFAGYESPHNQGEKIDIPYSNFVDQYGEEEGRKRAKEFIKKLRESGFLVTDEEEVGRYGVIDIKKPKNLENGGLVNPEPVDEKGLEKLKDNIMREKADLASGGEGPERVTMDDLLGSIFDLNIQDEEIEEAMLSAAFEGRLNQLEDLIKEHLES